MDLTLEPLLREVQELTDYASAFRYPEAPYEPDAAEAMEALSVASRLCVEWISAFKAHRSPSLPDQEVIAEITRRLVEFYQPARIYLFGSTAHGNPGRTAIWISWSSVSVRRTHLEGP